MKKKHLKKVWITFEYVDKFELQKQLDAAFDVLSRGVENHEKKYRHKHGNELHLSADQWYLKKRDYKEQKINNTWTHIVRSRM